MKATCTRSIVCTCILHRSAVCCRR